MPPYPRQSLQRSNRTHRYEVEDAGRCGLQRGAAGYAAPEVAEDRDRERAEEGDDLDSIEDVAAAEQVAGEADGAVRCELALTMS